MLLEEMGSHTASGPRSVTQEQDAALFFESLFDEETDKSIVSDKQSDTSAVT